MIIILTAQPDAQQDKKCRVISGKLSLGTCFQKERNVKKQFNHLIKNNVYFFCSENSCRLFVVRWRGNTFAKKQTQNPSAESDIAYE